MGLLAVLLVQEPQVVLDLRSQTLHKGHSQVASLLDEGSQRQHGGVQTWRERCQLRTQSQSARLEVRLCCRKSAPHRCDWHRPCSGGSQSRGIPRREVLQDLVSRASQRVLRCLQIGQCLDRSACSLTGSRCSRPMQCKRRASSTGCLNCRVQNVAGCPQQGRLQIPPLLHQRAVGPLAQGALQTLQG